MSNPRPPSRGRRVWWKLALTVLALLGLCAFFYLRDDGRISDDSDLAWEQGNWTEEENGYPIMLRSKSDLEWDYEEREWARRRLRGDIPWVDGEVTEWLERMEPAADVLVELRGKSAIASPALGPSWEALSYSEYLSPDAIESLGLLAAVRVNRGIESGDPAAAELALRDAAMLPRLSLAGNPAFEEFIRTSIGQGFCALAAAPIADSVLADRDRLLLLADELCDDSAWAAAQERAIKHAYQGLKHSLIEVSEGRAEPDRPWERFWGPGSSLPMIYWWIKPLRTANDAAARSRALIGEIGKPWNESEPIAHELQELDFPTLFSGGNPGGVLLLYSVWPFEPWWLSSIAKQRSRLSAIRTKLALRRYFNEHDELPSTFAELVPRYLDTLPVDWMDGEPLRYDPDRGVVWSVGTDLVDNGGDPDSSDDIVVLLRWVLPVEEAGPPEEHRGSVRRRRVVLPP